MKQPWRTRAMLNSAIHTSLLCFSISECAKILVLSKDGIYLRTSGSKVLFLRLYVFVGLPFINTVGISGGSRISGRGGLTQVGGGYWRGRVPSRNS